MEVGAHQIVEHLPSALARQIERDAALAAIGADVEHRVPAVVGAEPARPVASGRLDLDDVGTVERHQRAAVGPGDSLTEVEDLQTSVGTVVAHLW